MRFAITDAFCSVNRQGKDCHLLVRVRLGLAALESPTVLLCYMQGLKRGQKMMQNSAALKRHGGLAPGLGNPDSQYFRAMS